MDDNLEQEAKDTPQKMSYDPVPAGWYPDPEEEGRRRYWDGQAWVRGLDRKLTLHAVDGGRGMTEMALSVCP